MPIPSGCRGPVFLIMGRDVFTNVKMVLIIGGEVGKPFFRIDRFTDDIVTCCAELVFGCGEFASGLVDLTENDLTTRGLEGGDLLRKMSCEILFEPSGGNAVQACSFEVCRPREGRRC